MKITIGILAYNEADSIPRILHSLSQQSLFQDNNKDQIVEVIVVPNGCSDRTAEVARNVLHSAQFSWQVCEVEEAGKSNAWNLFIHQFSASDTDFFFLMDADIMLYAWDTLEKMLDVLIQNPNTGFIGSTY